MKIVFRADASVNIGSGHVMRCLTLAEALREDGNHVVFICRPQPGHLIRLVEQRGFTVRPLPELAENAPGELTGYENWLGVSQETDAAQTAALFTGEWARPDWLVVDHYGLNKLWESAMRPSARQIMVIDDLANRVHACDLLLDQNLRREPGAANPYAGLVPERCRLLLGPTYTLLRPEFHRVSQQLRPRDGSVRRILIFFGGSDLTGETAKALAAVQLLKHQEIRLDVVVGANNPNRAELERLCATRPNTAFYCQVDNMAELMAEADLAIGAGGTTTWERCYLGLASLTVAVAENQLELSQAVADAGASLYLGWHAGLTSEKLAQILRQILADPTLVQRMSNAALQLLGEGAGTKKVITALKAESHV